jgi:hypothetical protein
MFQLLSGLLRKTEPDSALLLSCLWTPNSNFGQKSSFENGIFDVLAGGLIRQTTLNGFGFQGIQQ